MSKYRILPRGTKIKQVFKSWEEFDEWRSEFYKKIKPELDKLKGKSIRLWPKKRVDFKRCIF